MPKITELYAYVCADKDEDDEGVPALHTPSGLVVPLMGADSDRAQSMREHAQEVANMTRKPVKLVRSTVLEVVDTILPEAQNG
jgi:hypothetical protein